MITFTILLRKKGPKKAEKNNLFPHPLFVVVVLPICFVLFFWPQRTVYTIHNKVDSDSPKDIIKKKTKKLRVN